MKFSTVCLVLLFSSSVLAQIVPQTAYKAATNDPAWVQLMYAENPVASEVREAYEAYYATHELVKNQHTQYYKRWMRVAHPYSDANGQIVLPDPHEKAEYLERYNAVQDRDNGEWEEMGPWHFDPEVAMYFQVQSPGACHVYTVEQAPSNPDVIYCGTATAGLWKSVDKGLHWELKTRGLLVQSVYSIAIDPNNENLLYFGEGNGTIWKSGDGGDNWSMTGDAAFQALNFWCRDLKFIPGTSSLIAATNQGLKRTDDAGLSWTNIVIGEYMEIEFHPTNPDIVYTVRLSTGYTTLRKSTDGGLSFSSAGDGWPEPGVGDDQQRCEISVSAAAPDNVYCLASGSANGGSGLYGIYLSEDAGENFTFQCCGDQPAGVPEAGTNPNTLGWSEQGEGDGGQYYYDLGLDVSPTDPDLLFSAGINVWRSEDSGVSWELNGHWVTWAGENTAERYTHADVHDVKFFETENGVDMWIASDGGLFYSADQGDNIEPRMYGLHGTDFWGWQAGFKQGDVMLGGTYHNGTLIKNADLYYWGLDSEDSGGWLAELAGDNFRGFVNPGDASIGYHDGGAFNFSDDRFTRISGRSFDNSKRANTSYYWGEYGNMEWDPTCYNHFYSPVETELWKTEDGGSSWELIHDFGGNKIVTVKVAPRDPNTIYVTHRGIGSAWKIWRTTDGGDSWTDVTPNSLATGGNGNNSKYIEVDGIDPQKLWCTLFGNQVGYKVFESTNGGDGWSDISSADIEDEYVTQLVHQRGTNGGLYIGTDRAVYYKNEDMADWVLYNNQLPAQTPVVFMQNFYCDAKVRVAGPRSVHQCDFYESSDVIAGLTASKLKINLGIQCEADTIRFTDNSVVLCEGATYSWAIEGATTTATDEETVFAVYSTTGTFDVSLTVTDSEGNTDTVTWPDLIEVVNEPVGFPIFENFNAAFPPEHWQLYDPEGAGSWEHATVLDDETNGVAQFPNYWVNTEGQTDLLIMPAQDFSDVDNGILHFDVSYQLYADYIDGLAVWYKLGDDPEWNTIYEKSGAELAVEDNYTWFWYDLGGELLWRTDTVDLAPLAGESCVTLAFANLGGYGNHIWLDNVNLTTADAVGVESPNDQLSLSLFPNPASESVNILYPAHYGDCVVQFYDGKGSLIRNERLTGPQTISMNGMSTGIYQVRFIFESGSAHKRLIVR
jgi:photosystem II stability/assembly factor-like uncharacterized protein